VSKLVKFKSTQTLKKFLQTKHLKIS